MSLFLETIKLFDGKFYRLSLHQQRLEQAFAEYYPNSEVPDLKLVLENSDFPHAGFYKCRILIDITGCNIHFEPYIRRDIKTLKLVETRIPSCAFKFANRSKFGEMIELRGDCDDVLLFRDGYITDTSYANVAFFDGKNWLTPQVPLIYGVNRASLLADKKITKALVKVEDLVNFKSIRMFNAMIEFGEIELSVLAIT